ncbi:MAG: 4-alpha-glucanotransferase [Deltaproteobacteria bacterium]|nr:4-alpha-glucanotransferase [Deltaproteobacteria bacterium]
MGMLMADVFGIEPSYWDITGQLRHAAPEVIERIRKSLGSEQYPEGPPEDARLRFVRSGEQAQVGRARIELEAGGDLTVNGTLPPDLPIGYHTLHSLEHDRVERLFVTPGVCYRPPERAWGFAVQLYATRSKKSWGIGDFGDLGNIAAMSKRLGAGMMLLNPVHAPAPHAEQQPSPYFPVSRRFLSPLYIDIEAVPGANDAGVDLTALREAGRKLNGDRRIDRDAVWKLKRTALEAIWARHRPGTSEFQKWAAAQGRALREFATWCVLVEKHGPLFRKWPTQFRNPSDPAVAAFGEASLDRVRFFEWMQWLARTQLAGACTLPLTVQDLPVGVDAEGADAWAFQDVLAEGVRVGAPPDPFNWHGQNWGVPPFVPWRLRQSGYRAFIETLRDTLSGASGLRIDHVMGLSRLWWIPPGCSPTEGAYVRYPAHEFFDIIAIESHRAKAVIVGEDLGTVEAGFREELHRRQMLSYRVLWFEEGDPAHWPELALASVTTHDLPTVAGLFSGADFEQQQRFGIEPDRNAGQALKERLARDSGLPPDASVEDAILGTHKRLSRAATQYVVATLEDAVAEAQRPNVPGAAKNEPENWSRALSVAVEDLEKHPLVTKLAETLGANGRATKD